jgi:hypothetical protein
MRFLIASGRLTSRVLITCVSVAMCCAAAVRLVSADCDIARDCTSRPLGGCQACDSVSRGCGKSIHETYEAKELFPASEDGFEEWAFGVTVLCYTYYKCDLTGSQCLENPWEETCDENDSQLRARYRWSSLTPEQSSDCP